MAGFAALLLAVTGGVVAAPAHADVPFEIQSLDGFGNNEVNPEWGQAGTNYSRVAPARYADGASEPVDGPDPRNVSNRVFNDVHQNLFSERNVTQWGFVWGQFVDHTFGLREGILPSDPQGERRDIPFDADDPIEEFTNDLGVIGFTRSNPAEGTGVDNPREQVNNNSSYIDAQAVYGTTEERLEWMREGPVDGDLGNNSALLLMPDQLLPRRDERGDVDSAPEMELGGRISGRPAQAVVAGDVRANENMALQATHTLFAREHNRIVRLLPDTLSDEDKFQIARRVVIAEQQFITYTEFLPTLGINPGAYRGYDPNVNANLGNEFATVAYRAHSMVHGEFELATEADRYTPEELAAFEEMGIEVTVEGEDVELAIPLNLAFFNPDLLEQVQVGPALQGFGLEAQYRNDEQIDNQLRSVLFQIPVPGNPDCLDGPGLPECFDGVVDLGAVDIARARDHGMPSYNQLRAAVGLAPKTSFTDITGEDTAEFPPGVGVDDPASLDFVELFDIDGNLIVADPDNQGCLTCEEGQEELDVGTEGTQRTTVAARLQAIYRSVDDLDPFVGMIAEEHIAGTDFGELQRAIWTRQFDALRHGDRFFYENDPGLSFIQETFGIDFRTNLGDVIANNSDIPREDLAPNVFEVAPEPGELAADLFGPTAWWQHPEAGFGLLMVPAVLSWNNTMTSAKRRRTGSPRQSGGQPRCSTG